MHLLRSAHPQIDWNSMTKETNFEEAKHLFPFHFYDRVGRSPNDRFYGSTFHVFSYDFPLEMLVTILCRFRSVRTKSGRLLVPERCDLLVQKSAFEEILKRKNDSFKSWYRWEKIAISYSYGLMLVSACLWCELLLEWENKSNINMCLQQTNYTHRMNRTNERAQEKFLGKCC